MSAWHLSAALVVLLAIAVIVFVRAASRLTYGAMLASVTILAIGPTAFVRVLTLKSPACTSRICLVLSVVGAIAATLAGAYGCAYLVKARQLRRKRLGGTFWRLPSLQSLHHSFRIVATQGYALSTVLVLAAALDPCASPKTWNGTTVLLGAALASFGAAVLFFRARSDGWRPILLTVVTIAILFAGLRSALGIVWPCSWMCFT